MDEPLSVTTVYMIRFAVNRRYGIWNRIFNTDLWLYPRCDSDIDLESSWYIKRHVIKVYKI